MKDGDSSKVEPKNDVHQMAVGTPSRPIAWCVQLWNAFSWDSRSGGEGGSGRWWWWQFMLETSYKAENCICCSH